METRKKVISLREEGLTYEAIKNKLGLASLSTVHYHLKGTMDFPPRKTVLDMEIGDTVGFSGNGKKWVITRLENN